MLHLKKIVKYSLFLIFILESCTTLDKYNAQINKERNVKDLKSDIDYIQTKLIKLHPDLYHYISKNDLTYKFDSLRSSIIAPMTSNDFYFRLGPILSSIKQGHIQIYPLTKKMRASEMRIVKKSGTSPLFQFDFELIENKLYVVRNISNDSTIKPGTEVLAINSEKPEKMIYKYENMFSSDGQNKTYIPKKLANGFSRLHYYQYGIIDSVSLQIKFNDSIRIVNLKRILSPNLSDSKNTKKQIFALRQLQKDANRKRNLHGYNTSKRTYSKQLYFPDNDSSLAVLKILDFMNGNYKLFYKKSFRLLDSLQTESLIIDLRDNPGGRLSDVNNLYSYLADSCFHFIEKSEVSSKTSLWYLGFFNNKPPWFKIMKPFFIPSFIALDMFSYLMTTKGEDSKYYFPLLESKLTKPKINHFKGKIYVIINGGSFSATSLLSSNLHGSKKALFVGQETGGAYNGCVAGFMPTFKLPKSKLSIKFGLLSCETPYKSEVDGRGIFPDIEIIPTQKDRINKIDPEMQWILNNIKNLN